MDSVTDFFEKNNTKNLLQVKKANPTEWWHLPNKATLTQVIASSTRCSKTPIKAYKSGELTTGFI